MCDADCGSSIPYNTKKKRKTIGQFFYAFFYNIRVKKNPVSHEFVPGSCGDCLYYMAFASEEGLGYCPSKKELREECDAGDSVNRTCIGFDHINLELLCLNCDFDFATCKADMIFLQDHPMVEKEFVPRILRDKVVICNKYLIHKGS